MHRVRIILMALILLSACGTPVKPVESRQEAARVSASGVFGTLLQMQLPDGWQAVDESETNGTVTFALPSVIGNLHDATTDRDFFTIRPLMTEDCASEVIVAQAGMSDGEGVKKEDRPVELTKGGGTYGYAWNGFSGIAGGATEPDSRFWCIASAKLWSDIEIRAQRTDAATVEFIGKTFVPLWLEAQH